MAAPVIQKAYIQDINRPIEVRHGGGLMFTGDANADRISVALYDCQTPFALSGSVTGTCIRNDGQTVVLTGGILGGNTAYVVLAQSCFVVPGPLAVTIRVSAGGVSTTVLKAMYTIDQTTTEEIVDPGHVVPDISDIVAEYARMQAASDAAEAAAANANEAAQFATDDEWTNGDTLQTGRVYQTLHMANFEEETAGQYLRVISGNVAQAERVNQSGWSVYRYDLPHRMLIRLESIEKNTPTVQGVLPMAAVLTSGSTETLYSIDSDRTGTYILADALLCNYNTTINASAIKSVSITAVANRQFEDVIVCLDHAADFDKIVVFGDSIFANYINSTTVGNGVMAQFASLMGLPVVNNAVGGATLSTIQTSPKNVVQQVQDYIASATPGGTPLYMIDGGTNDQYNGGAGLANLGQYTDGVNGITNTIYGATYRIINDLLGFGAQPWQIVITTPIPKGIRGDAAYTATMDAQLTAIAGAMAEIAMVQQCNVINGYGAPFDNLTTDTAKAIIMPDDTHPSVYGAKLYAERIFRLLGVANQQEVASLKSALNYDIENGSTQLFPDLTTWYNGYLGSNGVLVSAGSVISPTSAPIKLAQDQKVVVNCGTLVCGVSYFRYNVDTQKYTRHYAVDQTNKFDVISDGDNFYYGLTFKRSPQTTIAPNEFNGYIGQYTDWRLKIDENATKLSADGMVEVFTDLTQWNAGYFGSNGVIASSSYRCTPLSTPFLLYAGDTIEIDPGTFSCGVAVYTYTSGTYARQSSTSYTEKTTITYATDKYISFDFGKTPAGQTPATDFTGYIKYSVAWKTKIYNNSSRISALETTAASGNYLAGKKLVACGDSITAAVNPGGGNFDSYARLTAQRNGMTFDLNAVSGSTMTNVSGRNPFCVDRYQQIPSDFDYLTIWFGFNDGAYAQVGTINDTEDTTFYGAYKKVMDYYLATYPTKKIGLIVPYMSNAAFQQAVRDISEMYGVPCLDLPDYNQCSIVWGDANAAQSARKSALTYDGTHPNQTGHEFISTMYEAFLRRL